jgi:hypothetical protein
VLVFALFFRSVVVIVVFSPDPLTNEVHCDSLVVCHRPSRHQHKLHHAL